MTTNTYQPVFQNGTWLIHAMDAGIGTRGVCISYQNADGCSKATFSIGNSVLGTVMCISDYGTPSVCAELMVPAGIHDISIVCENHLQIVSVTFTQESPYETDSYRPVSDDCLQDNGHETWVAVDELGRTVLSCEDVRGKQPNKQVGIFYWTWRDAQADPEPLSMVDVLRDYPGAEYNENHPVWTKNGKDTITSWNEPLYGYYLNRDAYVIRRHAILLANAGIDFVLFDCTNGSLLWKQSYMPLLEGFRQARADGIRAPKIAFMLNFGPMEDTERMLRALYQDLYRPGRYRDLWFMLDGKPMIMAYKDALPESGVCASDTKLLNDIRNFFTFRCGQPSYGRGQTKPDMWGWLEKAPQHKFGERPDGSSEMMTVGVAQNCTNDDLCTRFNIPGSFGRSYTHACGHTLLTPDSYKYGYNFQEQWERAYSCDPDIVFVTGWNEWIMGRWHEPWVKDEHSPQLAFVDQYDPEHSRDIEMDMDHIRDNYYLQLCSNVRRFKGANQRETASDKKTIHSISDMADVRPIYRNSPGTTIHRDCDGFGSTHYTNQTGRNDIIEARVARDDENLYFYVKCAAPITPPSGENWMTLLLDTDRNPNSGWNGYKYAVNRAPLQDGHAVLERYTGNAWETIGTAPIILDGCALLVTIPRKAIGLENDAALELSFKWLDNIPLTDVMLFYRDGCAAPLGRFAYLYKA